MRMTKKILSMILALVMVLGLLPTTVFATGEDVVYLSISFESNYIDDKNGNPIVYVPVPMSQIKAIDLAEYGLDNMLFDADGDGAYETTALQLLIYAHEELYGGDWSDVNFDALPGSSYFKGGIFGFTENLVYFHNGDFPVDETQQSDSITVGATSDRIVLEAGDFLDVASFGCYNFLWDQAGGFHLFADGNNNYTHDYTVNAGEALNVKLKHSFCDLMFGQSWVKDAADYEIYYGSTFGEAEGSVTTDESGCAAITFPTAGTYYVWCEGGVGIDDGYTHTTCETYMETGEPCIVSSPAFAKVTVAGTEPPAQPETPRQPQSVTDVLNATLAMQATTVAEPSFGTNYGEWTVFGLARGSYYANDSQYFADYYDRIVEYVNTNAAKVGKNGALDKNKSTDNSRLIMALASIGKDATSVGSWNLVEAYSANGMNWIRKQGMNGTIWTLIALDCGGYETSDPTIRQQCVDAILTAQHDDGGWSLVTAKAQPSNVDITGMTLTALYPYRDQPAVAAACETAFNWLSESQLDNGGFPYGKGETSESCVWAIVAATTWGINPDTDARFIKNGNSAIDNLLTYYLEDEAKFEHGRGAGANAMATDQATYALVAYDRFINGKTALYDYSDVIPVAPGEGTEENADIHVSLGLPGTIMNVVGSTFKTSVTVDKWDNDGHYKLIDFVMNIPDGVEVTDVKTGERLSGGKVEYHLEETTNKLRCVYFDANKNSDLTISGSGFPAEIFNIQFKITEEITAEALNFKITGMSIKLNSDSSAKDSMLVVNTTPDNPGSGSTGGSGNVGVTGSVSYSAKVLYTGDNVDLIPATKKAIAVAVAGLEKDGTPLAYNDGETNIVFQYSAEITNKSGVATYVALVNATFDEKTLINLNHRVNFKTDGDANAITFGDANNDSDVNAQDALAIVNAWLRKENTTPDDSQILRMNVNGDSRINTFDALGIVEAFVDQNSEYQVIVAGASMAKTK